jgi:hypothetical protein
LCSDPPFPGAAGHGYLRVRRIHTRQYLATTASDPLVASPAVARADAVLNGTTIIGSIVGTPRQQGSEMSTVDDQGRSSVVSGYRRP